jgi:DNA-binding IclR family transcriptional regulator
MSSDGTPNPGIKSDNTLFSIIEHLRREGQSGVTELAKGTGHSKSVIYNHLQTMVANGYARNVDRGYVLGLKFLTVGGAVRVRNDIAGYAIPVIDSVAKNSEYMISLVLMEGPYGVFSHIRNEWEALRQTVPLGDRYPLHQNGAGKAILSQLEDEEVRRLVEDTGLAPATDQTISDLPALFEDLEDVRKQGYATSQEERVNGFQSVSAAINVPESDEVGAISIASPADQIPSTTVPDPHIETVNKAVNEVRLRFQLENE